MPGRFVIVVAGGSGSRMQSALPKQFLEVYSRPILMYTLEVFYSFDPTIKIILVLPESYLTEWPELCKKHSFRIDHQIAKGGATRFQSVKNGLSLLPETGLVAVHDGVRPFVSQKVIADSYRAAELHGNAVVSLLLKESIREMDDKGQLSQARDRRNYRLVQTPQTFKIEILKKAYLSQENELFTDDATVVESLGHPIHLIDGNDENIKITHPADLALAETFLKKRNSPMH